MKMLDVAWKDIAHSFRSMFAIAFMFGVPILITVMFYVMFGGTGGDEAGFALPTTKVQVVNLDQGVADGAGESMGALIVELFKDEQVRAYVEMTEVADPQSARAAVDAQEAGVALIIPENLSAAVFDPRGEAQASIEVYQDPTLTLGPNVVKAIARSLLDSFSGTRIALSIVNEQLADADIELGAAQTQVLVGQYVQWLQAQREAQTGQGVLDVEAPPGKEAAAETSMIATILGLIQTGMMIFYAFFTGAMGAESILTEEEKGTLPRLFTTPTPVSTVLSGKFLANIVTILVQIVVLVAFGRLVFGIQYGAWGHVILATLGLAMAATSFGIFMTSWLKDTRQAGMVYGGVVTVTGMVGIVNIFTLNSSSSSWIMEILPLFVPQGWAMRAWQLSMEGAATRQVLLMCGALLVWSAVLFTIGRARFYRRYA